MSILSQLNWWVGERKPAGGVCGRVQSDLLVKCEQMSYITLSPVAYQHSKRGAFIMRSRTDFTRIMAACLLLLAGGVALAQGPVASVTPDVALARLKAGNARFVANPVSQGQPTAARRAATAQSQSPFAIIVGCADSRTAPELVFDQNIGDLFVIRTAGNLVDDHGLGSVEYAVDHLGTRLIVVLGHERCGAVKAALASATAPGHVNALVRDIQ